MSDKLTPKSVKCIFVGYSRETLGYSFYNREENKVFVARNGVFLANEFLGREASGQSDSKKFKYHSGMARRLMRSYRSLSGNP